LQPHRANYQIFKSPNLQTLLYTFAIQLQKMKQIYIILLLLIHTTIGNSQSKKIVTIAAQKTTQISKPKLVVGIVIDQMRWDYLQRFQPLFKPNGGFNRMMSKGFSCNNTMLPYTPTVTACGHTCIYTGSVPNIHGITGNNWWDKQLNQEMYCTQDDDAIGIGNTKGDAGKQSPKNMLVTTIGDELKLATNFKSKVIGIAIKDRGAILPAGHSANAAYWYDKNTGSFISSNHYITQLPAWVNTLNDRKLVDSFYKLGWQQRLTNKVYLDYCTADENNYESRALGKDAKGFPYNNLSQFINKDYSKIISTPYGNTLTLEMATAALQNEDLGKDDITDLLAISFSSPDYIGHSFGPNSWELLDNYLQLDEALGTFFDELDAKVGAGNYLSFLTADHAVAHIPALMQEHKLPAGVFDDRAAVKEMNKQLKQLLGIDETIVAGFNYQLTWNHHKIDSIKANKEKLNEWIVNYLKQDTCVADAFALTNLMQLPMNKTIREMLANGYNQNRSGDVQYILKSGYIDGNKTGTTHGLWNPYDAHIPLLWYGWGIQQGSSFKQVYMTDIAATLAALLHIQMPSGSVGSVIGDIVK
jgi:predicted AlkP superfamily pyrophosphatase or phosphodiesterase